jgi:hypothetical protein
MPLAVLLVRTLRFLAISKMSVFPEAREVTSGSQGGQVINACGWERKAAGGETCSLRRGSLLENESLAH